MKGACFTVIASRTRRTFLRYLALGTGATLVVACAPAPSAGPTSAPPATAAPRTTTAPAAAPASTGKLTLAQGIDPRSLWGNSSTAQQEINISEQITEKLIEFTADASDFEPRLATEWKQTDDTTLQLKLRQGVKFTNGEEFDSASARYSIETMTKAPAYATFTNVIDGAEVVDKYTLNVKTKSPTLLHMAALAMGSFQYPAQYFQQVGPEGFGQKPIGTGPYRLVEWIKDNHVTLEANDAYWGAAPATKTVVVRVIPEGAAKLAALETGEVDFIIDVPLDAVERVERNSALQLLSRPSNRMFYLVPSTLTDTPLKDPRVRQALWYAVDVPALIQGLFKGRAKPLNQQILAPGFVGFDASRTPTKFDLDTAKQMLAEAGYPNGFDITFKYSAGRYAQDKEAGQAIASQLARAGIRARQEVLESGTYLTQLTSLQLNDMYLGGSLPPPDAHFMYQQFQTGFVYSYYSNPATDELLKKEAATANREERLALLKQMQVEFDKNPPYVPLYQPEDYYAGSRKLSGFTPRASQFLDLKTFKLA
jgi:peptide/nickel transport system substrate-binding protein